jgi:hypothetical protein
MSQRNPCPKSGQSYTVENLHFGGSRVLCSDPNCYAIFDVRPDWKYPDHEVVFFREGWSHDVARRKD